MKLEIQIWMGLVEIRPQIQAQIQPKLATVHSPNAGYVISEYMSNSLASIAGRGTPPTSSWSRARPSPPPFSFIFLPLLQ
jgi:hypothetical protein